MSEPGVGRPSVAARVAGDPGGVPAAVAEPTPPLVAVDGVWFRYGTAVAAPFVLSDVNLTVAPGEIVALIGRNGSGKSTLARHLNGLLKPNRGRVLVGGEDTRATTVARLAARVGFAFQNPDHQLFAATVAEDVAFGPRNLGLSPAVVSERVEAVLAALGLGGVADRHPLLLGYGIRRLVALAGVLALGAPLLVLDEPTVGLDRRGAERVLAVLHERRNRGAAALVISHDLTLVATHATRVVALGSGRVLADGPPRAILTDFGLMAAAGLAPPVVAGLARALAPFGVPADAITAEEFCDGYAAAWRDATSLAAGSSTDG